MWLLGNEFVSRSFNQYYRLVTSKNNSEDGKYCFIHFELFDYSSTRYASSLRNILPRLTSLLAKAIRECKYLPKVIVIVPDDDIIKQLGIHAPSKASLHIILSYLLEEMHRIILKYKNDLDIKAKVDCFPQMVWIAPLLHRNFANNKSQENFTDVLETIFETKYTTSMCALQLKKVWSPREPALYYQSER